MRILIPGASGRLGRMLRAVWRDGADGGPEIVPVFREAGQGDGPVWAPGDPVSALPRVDAVLALWGVTRGDAQALAMNVALAAEAVRLGRALGAARVLHCSSAAVYGAGPRPWSETDPTAPAGGYGHAKLEMERRVLATRVPGQVFMRIGSVAGAESLFGNMRPGGTVRLDRFDDGTAPRRSYIAPQALARAIVALCDPTAPDGPVNVAVPVPTGMDALARAAGCEVKWQPAPSQALRLVALDTALLSTVCPLSEAEADPAHLVAQARATGCWP
ncbi:sugar nucleotide-binding protein [Aestuariicoccus sp. KMU-90]|uniref:Sugar nucleotide-binding protein n=1 Tax=Thetidibacter halocola TaxID=2827239 RepID=A0A8J7WED3_9RHOB|nr:sugar nucleotide-binding protein [Thetidibacter halocola]